MAKHESRKRRSAAEWSKLIATWSRSGKSAKEFAPPRGIEPKTLVWWRWHLSQKKLSSSAKPQPSRRRARRDDARAPRLVEVEIESGTSADSNHVDVAWELEGAGGDVLRVHAGISTVDLERVLAAVTAPRSPR